MKPGARRSAAARSDALVALTSAPIMRSGSATLSTGRRRIDASPSRVNERPSWAAKPAGQQA